jgi:hypothetical protein
MAHRPPGRPKAVNPKDIKVTVRLSEHEADLLQRLARNRSLSSTIRMCISGYITLSGREGLIFDSRTAIQQKETMA